MKVTEEFVYWSDESTLNFDAMWGMYPRLQRSKYPSKYTMLYYCYYEPQAGMRVILPTIDLLLMYRYEKVAL